MTASGRLAALSVVVAIGAVAAYVLLLRVAVVRNHPEGYVVAFALFLDESDRRTVRVGPSARRKVFTLVSGASTQASCFAS